jgi:hypothetical protein
MKRLRLKARRVVKTRKLVLLVLQKRRQLDNTQALPDTTPRAPSPGAQSGLRPTRKVAGKADTGSESTEADGEEGGDDEGDGGGEEGGEGRREVGVGSGKELVSWRRNALRVGQVCVGSFVFVFLKPRRLASNAQASV